MLVGSALNHDKTGRLFSTVLKFKMYKIPESVSCRT